MELKMKLNKKLMKTNVKTKIWNVVLENYWKKVNY